MSTQGNQHAASRLAEAVASGFGVCPIQVLNHPEDTDMNPATPEATQAINPYRIAFFWWDIAAESMQLLWTAQRITAACLERWGQASMSAGLFALETAQNPSRSQPSKPDDSSGPSGPGVLTAPALVGLPRPASLRWGGEVATQDQAVPPVPPGAPEPASPEPPTPTPDPLPPDISDPPPVEVPPPPFREPPVMPTPVAQASQQLADGSEDPGVQWPPQANSDRA